MTHHPVNVARAQAARNCLPSYLRKKYLTGAGQTIPFMPTREAARELLADLLHLLHQEGDDVPKVLELTAAGWAEEVSVREDDPTATPMLTASATLSIHN